MYYSETHKLAELKGGYIQNHFYQQNKPVQEPHPSLYLVLLYPHILSSL